jgi:hypothetical protein
MNYGQIITEVGTILYGDSTAPTSLATRLHGASGLIARKRQQIMQEHNYWFMEKTCRIPILVGKQTYDLPSDFKEEMTMRFSNASDGDLEEPLVKINSLQIERDFTDYDAESEYPENYYIDYNDTTSRRRLNLYPKPKETDYTVTLGVGSTATSFSNTAFSYLVDGTLTAKAANAVGTVFTAANTINVGATAGYYWGGWLVQITNAGVLSTKPCGGLANQVYTSEDAVLVALPDADSGNIAVGVIVVKSGSGIDWVANTDVLTSGTGNTSVTFYNISTFLNLRYYRYLETLSGTDGTFDASEDEISIECPDWLVWLCVEDYSKIRYDMNLLQMAQQQILLEGEKMFQKNWKYANANSGLIPDGR